MVKSETIKRELQIPRPPRPVATWPPEWLQRYRSEIESKTLCQPTLDSLKEQPAQEQIASDLSLSTHVSDQSAVTEFTTSTVGDIPPEVEQQINELDRYAAQHTTDSAILYAIRRQLQDCREDYLAGHQHQSIAMIQVLRNRIPEFISERKF